MKALDKETAIARMNTFGRNGTPFLFVIDYMQEHSYVEPLDGIDTSASTSSEEQAMHLMPMPGMPER